MIILKASFGGSAPLWGPNREPNDSKVSENWAKIGLGAKMKNIDLGLYLPCFREVGHPRKLTFFTFFLHSVSDPLPRAALEATFPDVEHFRLHFGTHISSIFGIIFRPWKRDKNWNILFRLGISFAEFSAWVRLGGNHRRFSPLAWAMTGPALPGETHLKSIVPRTVGAG